MKVIFIIFVIFIVLFVLCVQIVVEWQIFYLDGLLIFVDIYVGFMVKELFLFGDDVYILGNDNEKFVQFGKGEIFMFDVVVFIKDWVSYYFDVLIVFYFVLFIVFEVQW